MTEERFAELTVQVWRLRQQIAKLEPAVQKRGLVIKQRSRRLRANPKLVELTDARKQLKAACVRLWCEA